MNQTLLEKVRCKLFNVGLGKEFWVESGTYACHLINRLPSTAIDDIIHLRYGLDNLFLIMIPYMFLVLLLTIM